MGVIWRKKPRPYMAPRRLTFDGIDSINGEHQEYWRCKEEDRLYRRDGNDFIFVKTKKLSEAIEAIEELESKKEVEP